MVRVRSEFQELNRRTVVNDHRYCHTRGGTVRFNQDFLAFECPRKVIHFKSNVRQGCDGLRVRGIFIEAHPLDAVRTGLKSRDVHLQPRQMRFSGPGHVGRDSDMVESPTVLRYYEWRIAVPPLSSRGWLIHVDSPCTEIGQLTIKVSGLYASRCSISTVRIRPTGHVLGYGLKWQRRLVVHPARSK
jgi:hypothetical protein